MRDRLNYGIRFLLLIIFVGYLGVISFYTHVHIVNGVTIVHSHPFGKDNAAQPSHTHTKAGFQLIHSLTTYSLTDDIIPQFTFSPLVSLLTACEGIPKASLQLLSATGAILWRAPPL